ncbi:MKI67 FHA domain-interacting nucleolar phosphoprotein-like [Clavelina lepadiformis]|uniref:MKI67 FHA domain-interacting nucleolar phosphoprotein-like n=1 Tax=Clavelina lepadiformis TaxID=159417 RepID=UPI0040411E4A
MSPKKSDPAKNVDFIALDKNEQENLSKKVKKLKKKKKSDEFPSNEPGVVFLKHIPNGFFEPQMKSYFEQFGEVKRLRLSRSKKTGRSKGYAYIEFTHREVAKVVAETMNNYLMFERCLKCEVVPPEKLHADTFKGSDRVFRKPTSRKDSVRQVNEQSKDPKRVAKKMTKTNKKRRELMSKLKSFGIEYDINQLKTNPKWTAAPRKFPDPNTDLRTSFEKSEIRKQLDEIIDSYDFNVGSIKDCKNKNKEENEESSPDEKEEEDIQDSGHESGPEEESSEEVVEEEKVEEENEDANDTAAPSPDVTSEILVDTEDEEVSFKTPPQSSRVKKRSLSSATNSCCSNECTGEMTPKIKRKAKTPKLSKIERKQKLIEKRKLLCMTV